MAEIKGTCEGRFAAVRAALAERLDSGEELGASIAVILDGVPVVDIWGGWADADKHRPWEQHTITNVWSTTKTMTALTALPTLAALMLSGGRAGLVPADAGFGAGDGAGASSKRSLCTACTSSASDSAIRRACSGWACTGSSSEMDGGGLPCVAQPENSTVEARSITGKADLRKRSFMAWLLRKNPVRGSTTGR